MTNSPPQAVAAARRLLDARTQSTGVPFRDVLPCDRAGAFAIQEATVRGLRGQRYAGDGAAYGNAELRLRLGAFSLLLPAARASRAIPWA